MYYLHGTLFSLDTFLHVCKIQRLNAERKGERHVNCGYSSGLVCDAGWPFLFLTQNPAHKCGANLKNIKVETCNSFCWFLFLDWMSSTYLMYKKENVKYFRKDFIQFCTVYQQKGGDVNKAQLHGCLSSKNYISSF